MEEFSHLDARGRAVMVDVGGKPVTRRYARARGVLRVSPETMERIGRRDFAKGDVLGVARLAGIAAAKKTGDMIPLCHPLPLDWAGVELLLLPPDQVVVIGEAAAQGRTGIEMEALSAVSVAALTLYDMCKAVDRGMRIESIALLEKSGGRSGHFYDKKRSFFLPLTHSLNLLAGSRVFLLATADGLRLEFDGGLVLTADVETPVIAAAALPARWLALGEVVLRFVKPQEDGFIYEVWRQGACQGPTLLTRLD